MSLQTGDSSKRSLRLSLVTITPSFRCASCSISLWGKQDEETSHLSSNLTVCHEQLELPDLTISHMRIYITIKSQQYILDYVQQQTLPYKCSYPLYTFSTHFTHKPESFYWDFCTTNKHRKSITEKKKERTHGFEFLYSMLAVVWICIQPVLLNTMPTFVTLSFAPLVLPTIFFQMSLSWVRLDRDYYWLLISIHTHSEFDLGLDSDGAILKHI